MMNTLMMMSDPVGASDYYEKNKVGRIGYQPKKRVGVSTVKTADFGYETALLDKNGAHPVERYKNLELAKTGHKKWVRKSRTMKKIIKLGTPDGLIKNKEITLKI